MILNSKLITTKPFLLKMALNVFALKKYFTGTLHCIFFYLYFSIFLFCDKCIFGFWIFASLHFHISVPWLARVVYVYFLTHSDIFIQNIHYIKDKRNNINDYMCYILDCWSFLTMSRKKYIFFFLLYLYFAFRSLFWV